MSFRMRTRVLFLILCSTSSLVLTTGFYISQQQKKVSMQVRVVSFDDFSDSTIGDATSDEGQELAQEFYEQIRRRQEEEHERRRQLERLEQALKSSSIGIPRRPFQNQQQQQQPRVRQEVLDFEREFRKWTGQTEEDEVTTSAGFFRGGSSVYSYPSAAGRGTAMNAIPTSNSRTIDNDDSLMTHAERAMLGVLPYILALAVMVSLAVGSGAFEASTECEVFQDAASSTATSVTAAAPFATVETSLQQHMDQILIRKNCVML